MQFEDSAVSLTRINRIRLVPVLVCAGICVIVMQTGFFSFFFLVPLGVCSVFYGSAAAWLGLLAAILGNSILSLGFSLYSTGLSHAGIDILYFSALSLCFTWIMAGPPMAGIFPVRTLYRFISASIAGALVLMGTIFALGANEGFSALLRSQIEAISSAYIASSGEDAARRAFLEQLFIPDRIIETFSMILLHGGALVSAFFLFFLNRQAAFILARLFRRLSPAQSGPRGSASGDLVGFCAPRKTIWVLSVCLPVIVLCRGAASLKLVEIAAWNLLVMCAIIFLAQGGGIVLFNLARRPMSGIMRLLCSLLAVLVVFSPGINVLVMGVLILMGIAETWLPLRKIRNEE